MNAANKESTPAVPGASAGSSPAPASQEAKPPGLAEAVQMGAFAGAVGGLATHYINDGKPGFPAFVIAMLLLGGVTGGRKIVALIVFGIVAGIVIAVFRN